MAEKGKTPAGEEEAHAVKATPAGAHAVHEGHGAHGAQVGPAHHAPDKREYFVIFGALFALTVLEVILANPSLGIPRTLVGIGLVGMAVTKAAMVGLYYMHLKHETKWLKYTVAVPMATPAVYALVLVTEAAWRLTR